MVSILQFIRPRTAWFGPDVTRIMGEAFDIACNGLPENANIEAIAGRIIAAAARGERDLNRLRDIGLAAMLPNRMNR